MLFADIILHDQYMITDIFNNSDKPQYKNITDGDKVAAKGLLSLLENENLGFTNKAVVFAARGSHLEIVNFLLTNNKIYPYSTPEVCEAMKWAAQNGDLEIVKLLCYWVRGWTVETLECAAQNGHIHVVQFLCECKSFRGTYSPEYNCHYAIDAAAEGGHLEILQYLKARYPNLRFHSALKYAAKGGKLEAIKWLYREPISEDDYLNYWIIEAMRAAVEKGFVDIVQFLFERNSKCREKSELIKAIGEAAKLDDPTLAEWLMTKRYLG